MRKFGIWAWALSLSLFVFGSTPALAASISGIEVRGNRKIEKAAILSRVKSKVGSPLSNTQVADDIRAIAGMNYFEQVQAESEAHDGEVGERLVFVVREKPVIINIEFKGLDAFDRDEIKDQVEIKQYEVLDVQKLNNTVEKLQQKYEEKGYYLADIRYQSQVNEQKNEATVTFIIEENDKIQVKDINIIGNKVLAAEDLKKVMQTKEGDAFSWLTGSGAYREAVFDRDIATLGYYYGTLGYVRARFGKPEVSVSPDKKWIYITFSVEEGEQYNVGKIDFSGDLLYSRPDLMEDMKLVPGETFNTDILRRETLRLTDKYGDLGYAFANVVPQPVIHDDSRTVDVVFEVDKGERVYIGKINVTGNTRTKDKVIRRELKIYEGELYSNTKKRESRDNVMRLGYFDNVEFQQSTSKTNANVVDIEIKVKERSTGQLVIGAGYASGNVGFTAQAQLSQNNFLGNGQVASLSSQILTGQNFYEFNLGFTEPYLGSTNWSLGGDVYQIQRILQVLTNIPTYQETRTGFDLKLGHPVLEFTNLYLTYKLEQAYVQPDSIIDKTIFRKFSSADKDAGVDTGTDVDGITSSVAANIVYDKRDDRFDPREGWYWSLAGELAGIGGDRNFVKTTANLKFFHPIVSDFIFRFNAVAGNITGLGQDVPPNELYIQGGLFSERGYDYLAIGKSRTLQKNPANTSNLSQAARDAFLSPQGDQLPNSIVVGGHNQVLGQAEVEFPLLKEARIRGVLFFDTGNAFDSFPDPGRPSLFANVGWGFRWFTPIGPLRFEFGYPIVQTGSPKFYFTIGPPF